MQVLQYSADFCPDVYEYTPFVAHAVMCVTYLFLTVVKITAVASVSRFICYQGCSLGAAGKSNPHNHLFPSVRCLSNSIWLKANTFLYGLSLLVVAPATVAYHLRCFLTTCRTGRDKQEAKKWGGKYKGTVSGSATKRLVPPAFIQSTSFPTKSFSWLHFFPHFASP